MVGMYIYVISCSREKERPYKDDSTASRLLSEVKHLLARLVLRWGTTLESRVLFFCKFPLFSTHLHSIKQSHQHTLSTQTPQSTIYHNNTTSTYIHFHSQTPMYSLLHLFFTSTPSKHHPFPSHHFHSHHLTLWA